MTPADAPRRGIAARPVAIPEDIDGPGVEKAGGLVHLPANVRWSAPDRAYDFRQKEDLVSVYEQVLQEGTDEDVRRFIEVDKLIALWDELVLPEHVRVAWASWPSEHRGLQLAC
jgi:hypothetical protein